MCECKCEQDWSEVWVMRLSDGGLCGWRMLLLCLFSSSESSRCEWMRSSAGRDFLISAKNETHRFSDERKKSERVREFISKHETFLYFPKKKKNLQRFAVKYKRLVMIYEKHHDLHVPGAGDRILPEKHHVWSHELSGPYPCCFFVPAGRSWSSWVIFSRSGKRTKMDLHPSVSRTASFYKECSQSNKKVVIEYPSVVFRLRVCFTAIQCTLYVQNISVCLLPHELPSKNERNDVLTVSRQHFEKGFIMVQHECVWLNPGT